MRFLLIVSLAVAGLWVLQGCSDKQKEAERLEQEMRDLDSGDSGTLQDTAAADLSATADAAAAVPEEPAEVKPAMPQAPSGSGYTVQVASCEDEDYARHLVDRYTGRGYEPFVTTITYNNQTYYRVRIGNFANYSEAKALMNELVDRYSISGIWVDEFDN